MAECPFCKTAITDEIARFGGPCPKCFIEIPGDDTPTDPGVAKRVELQLEQEQQRPWARILGIAALAAVVLTAAGAVVAWRLVHQRGTGAMAAEADLETFWIAPASEHRLPPIGAAGADQPGEDQTAARSSVGRSQRSSEVTEVSPEGSGQKRFDFIGMSDYDEPELEDLAQRTVEVGPGAAVEDNLTLSSVTPPRVEITRGSVGSMAISDPDEIYKAVGQALKSYAGQMTTCYERRLKALPDLRGTWETAFTITENGTTTKVAVRGQAVQDAELERCLGESIARWTFQPLVERQEIQKNYTFGPDE